MARSTNETAMSAVARPMAERAPAVTCAAIAAMAANTAPAPNSAQANATEPVRGRSRATNATTMLTSTTAFAASVPARAAASCACRPTGAERISSARSLSSSARVCRTIMNTLIRATAMMVQMPVSFIITDPSVGWSRP